MNPDIQEQLIERASRHVADQVIAAIVERIRDNGWAEVLLSGTLGSILGGIVAAAAAYLVLRGTKSHENKLAMANAELAGRLAKDQTEFDESLAVQSRQIDLMATYLTAVLDMANAVLDKTRQISAEALTDHKEAATRAWLGWSMQLWKDNPEFRRVSGAWNTLLRQRVDAIHSPNLADDNPALAAAKHESDRATFQQMIGSYIGNMQKWQVSPQHRQEIEENFRDVLTELDQLDGVRASASVEVDQDV